MVYVVWCGAFAAMGLSKNLLDRLARSAPSTAMDCGALQMIAQA